MRHFIHIHKNDNNSRNSLLPCVCTNITNTNSILYFQVYYKYIQKKHWSIYKVFKFTQYTIKIKLSKNHYYYKL